MTTGLSQELRMQSMARLFSQVEALLAWLRTQENLLGEVDFARQVLYAMRRTYEELME